nr:hypothetical protein [Clostridia bacterium]
MGSGHRYCTYGGCMAVLECETSLFDIVFEKKTVVSGLGFYLDGSPVTLSEISNSSLTDRNNMYASFYKGGEKAVLTVSVFADGIGISSPCALEVRGVTSFGADSFAMSTKAHSFFRSALGQPVTSLDDMLFDREADFALTLEGADEKAKKFAYSREGSKYEIACKFENALYIRFADDVYRNKYGIDYAPINKNATFKKAPSGWMTWYAVKFNAS